MCTFHSKASYPLCPMRMTRRSSPYLFLIHLMPCSWGSTMRGQRWQEVRMVAFSLDILSAGSPSFCQAAMSASSASMVRGSRSGVTGMGTLQKVWMSVYLNYLILSPIMKLDLYLTCSHDGNYANGIDALLVVHPLIASVQHDTHLSIKSRCWSGCTCSCVFQKQAYSQIVCYTE